MTQALVHAAEGFDEYEGLEEEGYKEENERNAKLGALGISILIHAVVLLLLALVVFASYIEVEPAPTNTVTPTPIEKDDQEDEPEPEPEVEVQVDVAVENVQVEVVTEVEMVVETTEMSIAEMTDTIEASDMGSSGAFAAIGAGGGNAGAAGGGAFFGAMGGGGGGGGKGVGFFGAKTESADDRILFIIDQSGSLDLAQQALIKDRLMGTVLDFVPSQQFEVLFFSGPTWVIGDDAVLIREHWDVVNGMRALRKPTHPGINTQWRTATPMIKDQYQTYLQGLRKTFATDWLHPFEEAYMMEPRPEVIFFLTDGFYSNSEEVIELIKQHPNIPVMTIGFAMNPGHEGTAKLVEISNITGGQHVAISEDEVQRIYNEEQPGVGRPYGVPKR